MGMYDTITCKYHLPMPEDPKGYTGSYDFQTKDLELALGLYEIDENGQLSIHRSEGIWVEGDQNSKSVIGRLAHFKPTKKWVEALNTTTTIIFYDYQHSENTDYDYFIEYEAVFVNGKITSIKLIKFEATDNAERKKKDIEFKKELDEWFRFKKTRKYKYFVNPYNKLIKFIFRYFNKILGFFSRNIWTIERKFLIK